MHLPPDLPPAIAGLELGDAELLGVAWDQAAPDVKVALRLGDRKRRLTLIFCWVSDMRIDLSFPKTAVGMRRTGPAMMWEVVLGRTDGNRWKASLDFGSTGVIQLECDDVRVEAHPDGT